MKDGLTAGGKPLRDGCAAMVYAKTHDFVHFRLGRFDPQQDDQKIAGGAKNTRNAKA
ncbi:MAG: hypothetical protein LBP73_02275 [Clostridiales Family XIII bacterium]|nr:hypothetical protein [Clostridiales Family XIII bacterium]